MNTTPARSASTRAALALVVAAGGLLHPLSAASQPDAPGSSPASSPSAPVTPVLPSASPTSPGLPALDAPAATGPDYARMPVLLSEEPLRLDSVGLSLLPPAGSLIQLVEEGKHLVVELVHPDGLYQIRVRVVPTEPGMATVRDALEGIRRGLAARRAQVRPPESRRREDAQQVIRPNDPNAPLEVEVNPVAIEPVSVRIAGNPAPGVRLYVQEQILAGRELAIRGYTIFPTAEQSPEALIVFELTAPVETLAHSQRAYELTVASATFEDPRRVTDARRTAILTGAALLRNLPREQLEALLDDQQRWFRLSRPAPGRAPADATEVGYRGIRFWRGRQSELQGPSGKLAPPTPDNPDGYLAEIVARIVTRDPSGRPRVVDTQGIYFLTPDRATEAWTIRTAASSPEGTAREPDPGANPAAARPGVRPATKAGGPLVFTETGVRSGRTLSVSISGPVSGRQDPNRVVRPVIDSDGYLSQFEALLLPRVLATIGAELDLAFYAYRTDAQMVSLRRDSFRADQAAPGLFTLRTTLRDEMAPQTSYLRADGSLIRTELPDGTVWEPIELPALKRLWTDKGLPTGELK